MNIKEVAYLAVTVVVGIFLFTVLFYLERFTGNVTSRDQNVTVTVTGANSVTVIVYNNTLTSINPTSNTITSVSFKVNIDDQDGSSDINVSGVFANFSRSGEPLRQNVTGCKDSSQDTSTSKNFTCTIDMWYFDEAGAWNINVGAIDYGNLTRKYNTTTVFTYGTLQDINIAPLTITFPTVSPNATNQTSNNDPTLINNSGNYNFANISVNGTNLYNSAGDFINVANMTVGNNTGSNAECNSAPTLGANATVLSHGSNIQIKHTVLNRGNNSLNNNETGQETLFYCFQTVPSTIPSGSYSTTNAGAFAWKIIGTT